MATRFQLQVDAALDCIQLFRFASFVWKRRWPDKFKSDVDPKHQPAYEVDHRSRKITEQNVQ